MKHGFAIFLIVFSACLLSCRNEAKWQTEEMLLPSGDVIHNRYRYVPGFLDTSYFGNWTITWRESGKTEVIPGYGYRLPKTGGTVFTNGLTFCFTFPFGYGDEIIWKNRSETTWQRMCPNNSAALFDCMKGFLDRHYPTAYEARTNERPGALAITNGFTSPADFIYLAPHFGLPPYGVKSVNLDAKTLTLQLNRPTPCLPRQVILQTPEFSPSFEDWKVIWYEDKDGSNRVAGTDP